MSYFFPCDPLPFPSVLQVKVQVDEEEGTQDMGELTEPFIGKTTREEDDDHDHV